MRFARRILHFRVRDLLLRRRLKFPRTPAWRHSADIDRGAAVSLTAAVERDDTPGMNIYGFLSGEFGLGESARQYVRALIAHDVPVALHDLDLAVPHGRNDREFADRYTDHAPFPVSLLFVNPDCLDAALAAIGEQELHDKYLMACWFWELGGIPKSWLPALEKINELLVASAFNEETFKAASPTPVLRIPVPISHTPRATLRRRDFGLADESFIFLCTFDFNSWIERKNPIAAIQAFTAAFADLREEVLLLIKTTNGFQYPAELQRLLQAALADPRVVVRDDIIGKAELAALQQCCDAYVSLHRSEGFGLGMAEAMLLGKPVIATGWSGNLEFMNAGNSCLVDYRLVEVESGEYVDAVSQYWAEPDVSHAAELMRRLVSDRKFAAELGAKAAADVSHRLSPAAAAAAIAARLGQIQVERVRSRTPRGAV